MGRSRTPAGAEHGTCDIAIYATGSTVIVGPEDERLEHRGPASDAAPVGDQLRRAVTVLHDGLDQARRFHARAGPRIGTGPATVATRRQGSESEIIRPVLLDPCRAWEVAGSGQLFAEPIPRLRLAAAPESRQAPYPMWSASLRTGWIKQRAAHLQVSASPSFNLTVLELVPATRRRIGKRAFLRAGLPVVEELARRLESMRPRSFARSATPASPAASGQVARR